MDPDRTGSRVGPPAPALRPVRVGHRARGARASARGMPAGGDCARADSRTRPAGATTRPPCTAAGPRRRSSVRAAPRRAAVALASGGRLTRAAPATVALVGQDRARHRRRDRLPEAVLDPLQRLGRSASNRMHDDGRGVRRARQPEAVGILDPHAVDGDHLASRRGTSRSPAARRSACCSRPRPAAGAAPAWSANRAAPRAPRPGPTRARGSRAVAPPRRAPSSNPYQRSLKKMWPLISPASWRRSPSASP